MNGRTSFDADGRKTAGCPTLVRPIAVSLGDEEEFKAAMEEYKRRSGRLFPTWSEILEVIRSLGYAKRIWKPVESWSVLPDEVVEDDHEPEPAEEVVVWYSQVETT